MTSGEQKVMAHLWHIYGTFMAHLWIIWHQTDSSRKGFPVLRRAVKRWEIRRCCRAKLRAVSDVALGRNVFNAASFFPDGCLNTFWMSFHLWFSILLRLMINSNSQFGMGYTMLHVLQKSTVRILSDLEASFCATWLLVFLKHPFGTGSRLTKRSPTRVP